MSTKSPVLAGPPGDCCLKGVRHSGVSVGKTIDLGGMQTYLSEPPSSSKASQSEAKRVLLFFADVWGPFFDNAKLLQDYFASFGFIVLGCDYFFGDPVHIHTEADFDRQAWMDKYRKRAKEAVPNWLAAVREAYGTDTKYCAVGYCFGGPFVLELATTDDVIASAFAHPAFLNEDHFRNIKKPLLMSCAETDHTFPPDSRHRAEEILAEVKATYYVQVFSGVSHGFGTRGDPEVENSRWAKEESARSIINWFIRFTGPAFQQGPSQSRL